MFLTLLTGCSLLFGGPRPMTDGDEFFDRPWPSDDRLVDGHPDMSDFPGADEHELVGRYIAEADKLDGFGISAPIYLRFNGRVHTDTLPTPEDSASTDAPIFIVDVDPVSPERGRLIPYTWDFQEDATNWQPQDLLAIQPVWGVPLRAHTTYAAVYTTDIAKPVTGFSDVWSPDDPRCGTYENLAQTLLEAGVDTQRVAWATVFTTQDPTREAAAVAWQIQHNLATPSLDQQLEVYNPTQWFTAYTGHLSMPNFQHGDQPYVSEGGDFQFDADGVPLVASWDDIEFVLSIPEDQPTPEDGWPVVIYAHGTGGDAATFADEARPYETAAVLAQAGLAGLSVSLPFHGDRNTGGDPAMLSFNYANPTAGRTNFRQAGLEQVYLARLLSARSHRFTSDDGLDVFTDPDRVAYFGHSHGGEVGTIATAFFDDTTRAVVLSGTGGGLSLSVVHRDAGDLDIASLLQSTFGFDDDEVLDETHPLVGMVQLLSEVTDPLSYAPYWFDQQPTWDQTPQNVLMFEGLEDIYTPPVAIEALAGAARQPLLEPMFQLSTVQVLQGPMSVHTPTQDDILAWDGSTVTGGLAQYETEGHYAVFDDEGARELSRDFLASALDGAPALGER